MIRKIRVGIFVFNDVEVLDFAGPFEVFSLAEKDSLKLFEVFTISETGEAISARNGLKVLPDLSFGNSGYFDVLIVPGGRGAEELEIKNFEFFRWIKDQFRKVGVMASVCTGALLLAECGLLNGQKATTHWMDIDFMEKKYPEIEVVRKKKFVDNGSIITSGGISSGINMSLHIVSRLCGEDVARETARRMEFSFDSDI